MNELLFLGNAGTGELLVAIIIWIAFCAMIIIPIAVLVWIIRKIWRRD
ncbi:hypothetical protein [Dysgonomonas sp. 521]|nr:hypothetical protein [Dysgonomonas sp. 521]